MMPLKKVFRRVFQDSQLHENQSNKIQEGKKRALLTGILKVHCMSARRRKPERYVIHCMCVERLERTGIAQSSRCKRVCNEVRLVVHQERKSRAHEHFCQK